MRFRSDMLLEVKSRMGPVSEEWVFELTALLAGSTHVVDQTSHLKLPSLFLSLLYHCAAM